MCVRVVWLCWQGMYSVVCRPCIGRGGGDSGTAGMRGVWLEHSCSQLRVCVCAAVVCCCCVPQAWCWWQQCWQQWWLQCSQEGAVHRGAAHHLWRTHQLQVRARPRGGGGACGALTQQHKHCRRTALYPWVATYGVTSLGVVVCYCCRGCFVVCDSASY